MTRAMSIRYILDEAGEPQACDSLTDWGTWYQTAKRHVADETVGDSRISTVFLGTDYNFHGGAPVLWETMVFGGKLDQEQARCGGLRANAEQMHARMVERVKEALK